MAGLPVTIRLLDPPLHEFLPPLDEATDEHDARADPCAAARRTRCSARAAAASG
jgi:phosphoenolpyruvate synthase/pyruvate phosphate dikinase